jgi:hypothetical protein
VSAKAEESNLTPEQLEDLYWRPVSILYMSVSLIVMGTSAFFSKVILRDIKKFFYKSG